MEQRANDKLAPEGNEAPPQRSDVLEPSRTSLLLFDTLNGHLKSNATELKSEFEPQVRKMQLLLAAARRVGLVVTFIKANHHADGRTVARLKTDTDFRLRPWGPDGPTTRPIVSAGNWDSEVIDDLAPIASDYVIPKYRFSAFHGTYLDTALRVRGVDTIIVVGGNTDSGVASTAYAARDLDYNLVIVRDACTAHELDNHEQFMTRLFPQIARVRSTQEVLRLLEPGTPPPR